MMNLYEVHGEVEPPIEGDKEVVLVTLQRNEADARERFREHFRQMDRRIVTEPTAISGDDLE